MRAAALMVAVSLGACATTQRVEDGGSRVEIIPLHPGKPPKPGKPQKVPLGGTAHRAEELGDGSLASELLAGARRLVAVALPGGSERFAAHLRAVALWDGEAVAPARAKVGDVVRIGGRIAVCERADGARLTLIGPDDDEVVRRFVLADKADID